MSVCERECSPARQLASFCGELTQRKADSRPLFRPTQVFCGSGGSP